MGFLRLSDLAVSAQEEKIRRQRLSLLIDLCKVCRLRRGRIQQENCLVSGEVSEWLKEHAWKVCKSKGFEGSNPSPTAIYKKPRLGAFFLGGGEVGGVLTVGKSVGSDEVGA
jgi:hypothetical protein